MRIALVSREVAGVRGGGIGTYVSEAGYALRAAGHHVTLVTDLPIAGDAADWATRGQPFDRILTTGDDFPRRVCGSAVLGFAERAFGILSAERPAFDYAEFADFGAAGLFAVLRQQLGGGLPATKLRVALHAPTRECLWSNGQEHLATSAERIVAAYEDEALRSAPGIWSPSARLRELVATRLGLDPQGIPLLRYPMDFTAMQAGAADPAPPAPRASLAELRFAFFGRIEARKGVPALVEAFRRMPELGLDVFGRDTPTSPRGTSLRGWLERDLPANVCLHEPLPRADMLAELARVDVCLLPSPWENWPNACLEAMGAARVVLGGKDGGMAEMIEPGTSGFLVDGRDPDDIVRVVQSELGAALDRLDQIGAAARERVRELSDPAGYVAHLERIVAAQPAPAVRPAAPVRVAVAVLWDGADSDALHRSLRPADGGPWPAEVVLGVVSPPGGPAPDGVTAVWQPADAPGRAGLLNAALAWGAGSEAELLVLLSAGDQLGVEAPAILARAVAADAEAAAFYGESLIVNGERRAPTRALPLPVDRDLVWQRDPSLGGPWALRREFLAAHGLAADAGLERLADLGLLLDVVRAGGRVRVLAEELGRLDARASHRANEPGWQTLLAELAHLVVAHPLPGTAPADAQTLAAVVRGFGAGAALAPLGARPWALIDSEPGETPSRLVTAAFAVLRRLGGVPVIGGLLRGVLRVAFSAHGRVKA